MTMNTSSIAVTIAIPRAENSSFIISSWVFVPRETPLGKSSSFTCASISVLAENIAALVGVAVTVMTYWLSSRVMVWGASEISMEATSINGIDAPVAETTIMLATSLTDSYLPLGYSTQIEYFWLSIR